MNSRPAKVKRVSTILIVMGILYFVVLVPLTLFGSSNGGDSSILLYTLVQSTIISSLLVSSGVGIRRGKRWAWWLTQIFLILFSGSFLVFLIENLLNKNSEFSPSISSVILLMTLFSYSWYSLFTKESMKYFQFGEEVRGKTIRKAFIISGAMILIFLTRVIIFR